MIFSWDDLKRLLKQKQSQIVRWSALLAAITFLISISTPPQFEAWATFKQSSSRTDQSIDLKNLIRTFSSGTAEGNSSTFMLSDTVLGKVVQQLGLQIKLSKESGWKSLLQPIFKNALIALKVGNIEEELPRFSSVIYKGEKGLTLKLRRLSDTDYILFDAKNSRLAQGTIGQPLISDTFQFTLEYFPSSLPKEITLTLSPLQAASSLLRQKMTIKPTREDRTLLMIKCRDPHRQLCAEIVNTLMSMYERYLLEENQLIIGAQLSYLKQRQEELSTKFDQDIQDHAKLLKQNLQSQGFLGIKDEMEFILGSLQTHQVRLDEVELNLRQIEYHLEKTTLSAKQDKNETVLVERYSTLLAEQVSTARELLNQVHRKEKLTAFSTLEHLYPIGEEFNQALHSWKLSGEELPFQHKQQEVAAVLHDLLEHLATRQQALRQGGELIQSLESNLTGISLESARHLFDHYSTQFDDLHAQLKQIVFIRDHLFDPHFEISTLSNILSDPVTQQLVQRSSDLEAQLCDNLNRSMKDRERLKITVGIHKRFLESHLEQTLELGKVRMGLIKEKLSSIYTVMKTLLEQEREALKGKIAELKETMESLPNLWVHENRLKFRADLTKGMMEGLVHITEAKNLSHYLYQVESRPLDKAYAPLIPLRSLHLVKTALIFAFGVIGLSFLLIIQSLIRGLPVTLTTLKELGTHTCGLLSFQSPLTLESLQGSDHETIRRMAAFLMESSAEEYPNNLKSWDFDKEAPQIFCPERGTVFIDTSQSEDEKSGAKPTQSKTNFLSCLGIVVAIIGERQTKFFPALTALLKKYHRTSCVIDCSFGKIVSKDDEPGLFQTLNGTPWATCLRSHSSYDFLPVGESSTESVELLKSDSFQKLLSNLSSRYNYLFILSRTSADSLEAEALLDLSQSAIIVAETSLHSLQASFSRQKEKKHVTFIQYPI